MFSIIFGVILPLVCLGVEFFAHFCSSAFFDPIPSWFHVGMIMWVAYANGWLMFCFANPDYKPLKRDALIIGAGIGISLIYALRFLPLIPAGGMCLVIWGLGLLVFGPMISFFIACGLARKLSIVDLKAKPKVAIPGISQNVFFGVFIGVMCVFLSEMPHSITRHALQRALSSDPLEARRGINTLLSFGSQDELLKFCYSDKTQMSDFTDIAMNRYASIDPMKARTVFYRVTGVPFNREKFPQQFISKGDEFFFRRWDQDLAGDQVGGRVDNLSLKNSDLEITCDPNSASAQLDWTFVFENMSDSQVEARTNIALPPGAVVSDLTLWINGVPQPAAFGSKSKTRSAYQAVVSRSRDPVLVTSAGGDRVLLQCFPVPVKGTMKTRVQISAPLALERDKATLVLPKLIENNFDIFTPTKTSIKSTTPVEKKPDSFFPAASSAGVYSIKGVIDQNKINSSVEPIVFQRNPNAPAASKIFTFDKTMNKLTQNIKVVHEEPTENVVIVVDGSKSMRPFTQEVSEALGSISDRLPWSIVLASDEVSALTPEDSLYQQLTPKVVASRLPNLRFQGGPDNASALVTAANIAAKKEDIKILWIHGPQPVMADFDPKLDQEKWSRPTIYSFEVEAGPNIVAEKLSNEITFKTVPRFGTVKDDLNKIIKQLDSGADEFMPIRTVVPLPQKNDQAARDTTHAELIKLWAYDQVLTGLRKNDTDGATRTATNYRIVTAVSGAVVLETKEDFANAGLTQKQDPTKTHKGANGEAVFENQAEVPSVPEPEMWLMLFIVGMLLLLQNKRVSSMLPLTVQRKLPWRN